MIYVGWLIVFFYSGKCTDTQSFISLLKQSIFFKNKALASLIVALPIGVIIHQLSVNIKNHIVANIFGCEILNDFPQKKHIEAIHNNKESTEYIFDKISNLNSFYYVRFDNGFLAPFLAFITVLCFGYHLNYIAVIVAIVLGALMLYYISRICDEMNFYFNSLKTKK